MEKALSERKVAFHIAVSLVTFFLVIHTVAFIRDWYRVAPWVDIPFHITGGMIGGLFFYWVFQYFKGYFEVHKNFPFTLLFFISLSALGGVFWEFGEFTYDYISISLLNFDKSPVQFGIGDTLGDILSGLIGTVIVAVYMRLRYSDKYKKHD